MGLPALDPSSLRAALDQHQLSLVAGTIFDDLVSRAHYPHSGGADPSKYAAICLRFRPPDLSGDALFQPPYLVIIDFGSPGRARCRTQRAGSAPQ